MRLHLPPTLLAALLLLLPWGVAGSEKPPTLFVDVEAIEVIDPLRNGFAVILHKHFVHHYLNEARLPTIYLTVLPLSEKTSKHNRMLYREDFDQPNAIPVKGLEAKTWYYVCIEFENMIRRHAGGNTSTDCRLAKTLDKFGARTDSTFTNNANILTQQNDIFEVSLEVEVYFPTKFMLYLSKGGAPLQSYLLEDPRSLRVVFTGLFTGVDYGSLCTFEKPLEVRYTMMGRAIHVHNEKCYFDAIQLDPAVSTVPLNHQPSQALRFSRKTGDLDDDPTDGAFKSLAPSLVCIVLCLLFL